jgi:hypothetical protein
MWDALSDGRLDLWFTIAAGPRQRSYIYHLWNLADICFMSFNTVFVMAIILSSSDSAPVSSVIICWSIIAIT